MANAVEPRSVASLPQRAGTIKAPAIAPFETADEIALALANRDPGLLTAAILQIDKRTNALVIEGSKTDSKDAVALYLVRFPAADGVYSAWDFAHKTNNSPLSAAVLSCLTSLVRFVSLDPFANDPPLIRRLLSSSPASASSSAQSAGYGAHLDRALNPGRNDVTVAALKLLNVVVGFGQGRYARRLFALMSWSPKVTSRLFRTRLRDASHPFSKPSIRTLLQMLVLSFLSSSDARLKTQVLEAKGLLSGAIKGLNEDHEDVVRLVLECLWTDIVKERKIGLEVRRNVFEESVVVELAKLYDVPSDDPASVTCARVSVDRFFSCMNAWLSTQINDSPARSFGPQRGLSLILRNLKVTDDSMQRALGLTILSSAPVLCTQFWARFPSSLDPRLSSRWISAITFATQAVSLPISTQLTSSQAPPTAQSVLDTIAPPSLNRVWYTKALQHSNELVSFLSALCLLASMQKAVKVLEAVAAASSTLEEGPGGRWAELGRRIREHIKDRTPDAQVVVALLAKSAAAKPSTLADDDTAPQPSAHHLRHTLALRLLYLYHRVAPSSISTLKFDFAKLPLQHVAPTADAEGLRAIASAYSLRLASVHSVSGAGAAGATRAGDYFRSTLAPLFQLYRTPSTASNRNLLLGILGRLLVASPMLFGARDNGDSEVVVWLSALPSPGDDDATLSWFEECVRKTFTAPLKVVNKDDTVQHFSPLLSTVLADLPDAVQAFEAQHAINGLLSFMLRIFFNFVGAWPDLQAISQLRADLELSLGKMSNNDSVRSFIAVLGDCNHILTSRELDIQGDQGLAELLESEGTSRYGVSNPSPLNRNIFKSLEGRPDILSSALAVLSATQIMLHLRPSDLNEAPTITAVLSALNSRGSDEQKLAVQVAAHRFLSGDWTSTGDEYVSGAIAFVRAMIAGIEDRRARQSAKTTLLGEQNALKAFRADGASYQAITGLVAAVLDASNEQDRVLAAPFCQAIVDATNEWDSVASVPSRRASSAISRILSCAPILQYMSTEATASVLHKVLSEPNYAADAQVDLLSACLARVCEEPSSITLLNIWSTHFFKLHMLTTEHHLAIAGKALALGARSLLPSVHLNQRIDDNLWRPHSTSWATRICRESAILTPDLADTLAAFVYRSSDARRPLEDWFNLLTDSSVIGGAADNIKDDPLRGADAAVEAYLEVCRACGQPPNIQSSILLELVSRTLSGDVEASRVDRRVRIIELWTGISPPLAQHVDTLLATRLASLDRDAFTPVRLRLAASSGNTETLSSYVNGAFAGLTRRFVDNEVDAPVTALVREIVCLAQSHLLSYKSHLLDPLVMAVCTHRLDVPAATDLAASLVRGHKWDSNEATRHLNAIFANPQFRPRPDSDPESRLAQNSIVRLVVELSSSSPLSAAAVRVVDKLIPFYGGTLSEDDRTKLALFQKIEYTSQVPISPSLVGWNPTADLSPLEPSRLAALGAVQTAFIKRACLRVCASSSTIFPEDHDAITYDPVFFLSFVEQAIAHDELKLSDWIAIVESGALSVTVAALASSSTSHRLVARATIQALLKKLETQSFIEKDELVLIFTHARNCIYSSAGEAIPAVIALFLANCVQMLGMPESPLYPAFMRFLLQRPILDQRDVPMFYIMFFTSSEQSTEDHKWLLRFLAEGLVRTQDWRIYRRRQVFELVASLVQSSRNDPALRKLALQLFVRATSLPQAARELLSRNGILGWTAALTPVDAIERRLLIKIVVNVAAVVSGDKLPVVADALDALSSLSDADEVKSADFSAISRAVADLVTRLEPLTSSSPSIELVLDRAAAILQQASQRTATSDQDAQSQVYAAIMAVCFARHSAGLPERSTFKTLFSRGISAGLAAGSTELKQQIVLNMASSD